MYGNAFTIVETDPTCGARLGRYETPHGVIETPCFAPVGTQGAIKAMTHEGVEAIGYRLILANTYHLYLRPGGDVIRAFGGLHRFMGWPHALLTDSGGYQVFSLARLRKINDEGVVFQSHIDGALIQFTPENVVEFQELLGSDIAMVLDECPPYPASFADVDVAVERTLRWAARSRRVHHREDQALFGIVQGGIYHELRQRCAERLVDLEFDGYAIGGLSVGEPTSEMREMVRWTQEFLPSNHMRYLMGVGMPHDIIFAVMQGIDLFDCVLPTRHARTGSLFTSRGRLIIKHQRYRDDERPLDPACDCLVCRRFSRAYLRHLFMTGEITALILNTYHNLYFYQRLMAEIRQAVREHRLPDLLEHYEVLYAGAESSPEEITKDG